MWQPFVYGMTEAVNHLQMLVQSQCIQWFLTYFDNKHTNSDSGINVIASYCFLAAADKTMEEKEGEA